MKYTDIIEKNLKKLSEKSFFIDGLNDNAMSYGEISDKAIFFASQISQNIYDLQTVSLLIKTPANIIPVILALWKLNATAAILDPYISPERFSIMNSALKSNLIITDQKLEKSFDNQKILILQNENKKFYREEKFQFDNLNENKPALILFSSGSTGIPKCIPLSLSNIYNNIKAFNKTININSNDIFLSTSPHWYAHGLYNSLLTSLFLGATTIYCSPLNLMTAQSILAAARKYKATIYHTTPAMLKILSLSLERSKLNPPKFKHIISGTARLDPTDKISLESVFKKTILQQYGMTESLIMTVNTSKSQRLSASVGKPVGCKIYIKDNSKTIPVNKVGEIAVKSKSCFGSYYNQPDETNLSFKNGFFYTGDLGYLNKNGYLFITGRKKDMIKKAGYNINPNEIDQIIMSSGIVKECVTVGVQDKLYGEEIYSFIITNTKACEKKLISFLKSKLPEYSIPKKIICVSDFPKTSTGKIDKVKLSQSINKLIKK